MYIDVDLNKFQDLPGRMEESVRMTRDTAALLEDICADMRTAGQEQLTEVAGQLTASLEEIEILLTRQEKLKYALDRIISIYGRSEERALDLDRRDGREGDAATGMVDLEETAGMIRKHDVVFCGKGAEECTKERSGSVQTD